MKKMFLAVLVIVILAGGSAAAAQVEHTSQPSLPGVDGTLEPLTQFDDKHRSYMVADRRYAYIYESLSLGTGFVIEVVIMDYIDPAHPQQIASARAPGGGIIDISVGEDYIYPTDGAGPFTVFAKTSDLTGRVTDHNFNPFGGVTLTLNSGAGALTGADGAYSFPDLSFGDYVVTPALGSFVFTPAQREVNIPSDLYSQEFVILPPPVSAILGPGITTSLTYTDAQGLPTSFIFPSGLVSSTAIAHITPTLASGFFGSDFAGHAFELSIDQGSPDFPEEIFTVPVSVTIHYILDDTAVITDTTWLALYRSDGTSWTEADAGCLTPGLPLIQEPGIFEGVLCQEGLYALYGPSYSIALPIESLGSISLSCAPPNCIPEPLITDQE